MGYDYVFTYVLPYLYQANPKGSLTTLKHSYLWEEDPRSLAKAKEIFGENILDLIDKEEVKQALVLGAFYPPDSSLLIWAGFCGSIDLLLIYDKYFTSIMLQEEEVVGGEVQTILLKQRIRAKVEKEYQEYLNNEREFFFHPLSDLFSSPKGGVL